MNDKIIYPENKDFIFTIFDDTDVSTLENIKPVYDYLYSVGLLTTKSVWPLRCTEKYSDFTGSHTLENRDYAKYVKELSERGFEIAFHGASMESNTREKTIKGIEKFYDVLGFHPRSYGCHAGNRENIYWGQDRFQFNIFRHLYRMLTSENEDYYAGNKKGSPYYWADICQKYIDYSRTFTYSNINLLNISRSLPYSVKSRPTFKSCFFSVDADNVEEFNKLLCAKNQHRLEKEKGVCIISTHFGKGFVKNNELHEETKDLLKSLVQRNGWFVPVSVALDFLKNQANNYSIANRTIFLLEFKWFLHALRRKFKNSEYEKTELEYLRAK